MRSRSRQSRRRLSRPFPMRPPAPKDEVSQRRDDTTVPGRCARGGAQPVLNPAEQRERAFLVGVEFRTRGRGAGKLGLAAMTPGAQAARDHAVTTGAAKLPADSPDFSWEESLDDRRTLATSAGAHIVGEFSQHRDRPEPATLIGK